MLEKVTVSLIERPFVFISVAMIPDGKIDTFERKGAAISFPA